MCAHPSTSSSSRFQDLINDLGIFEAVKNQPCKGRQDRRLPCKLEGVCLDRVSLVES